MYIPHILFFNYYYLITRQILPTYTNVRIHHYRIFKSSK